MRKGVGLERAERMEQGEPVLFLFCMEIGRGVEPSGKKRILSF